MANKEMVEAARKRAQLATQQAQEAAKLAKDARKEARDAGAQLDKTYGKLKRVVGAIEERESTSRAVTVTLAGVAGGITGTAAMQYAVRAVGKAIPFVGRNSDYLQGVVPIVIGGGLYAGELATRRTDVLPLGRDVVSRIAETHVALGLLQVGRSFMARRAQQQAAYNAAMLQAQRPAAT